jgi:phenylpyruvate tautomerase PptA (4-oxalocrotonate tautomerase family)
VQAIEEGRMPLVTALNLRKDDPLPEIEEAVRRAMTSIPALEIDELEVDLAPVREPDGYRANVVRINVDLWEGRARTKQALQDLAENVAEAFRSVVGRDRRVKVVIRPYDVGKSGWVSY